MRTILANYSASITELKKSPTKLLEDAGDEVIAILNHNTPSAYLVPSLYFEKIMQIVDEYELSQQVKSRLNYNESELVEVNVDELV